MHPPSSLWKKGSFYSLAGLLSSQESATHSGNLYQQIIPVVAEDPVRREYPAEARHCSCVRKAGWKGEESWFLFFFQLLWRRGRFRKRLLLEQGTFKNLSLINVPNETMKCFICWVLKLSLSVPLGHIFPDKIFSYFPFMCAFSLGTGPRLLVVQGYQSQQHHTGI